MLVEILVDGETQSMPKRDTKSWLQGTGRVINDTENVGEGNLDAAVRSVRNGVELRLDLQQAAQYLSGEGMFMTYSATSAIRTKSINFGPDGGARKDKVSAINNYAVR